MSNPSDQRKRNIRRINVSDNGADGIFMELESLDSSIGEVSLKADKAVSIAEETAKMEGPAGKDGLDGKDGEKGEPGDPGPQGEPGIDGERGEPGPKGRDGTDGKDGRNGKDITDVKAEVLADSLNTLKDAIDVSVIRGAIRKNDLDAHGKKVLEDMEKMEGRVKAIDQRWHGAGLSKVSHDTTLTGSGTPADPLHVVSSGSGTVTSVGTAGLISGGPITATGTITTSMATNRLVGRGTAGTGIMEEITLGTNLSLSGTTLNAAGGTITGTDTQILYFNGNDNPAGDAQMAFNDSTKRAGFQVAAANTLATVHADAVYGDTIAAPASLTVGRTLDTVIDSPATGSATQVNEPTAVSMSLALTQIDFVNAGSTSQVTDPSAYNYTCNGQTIDYRIYCYRSVSGTLVVNPNYYPTSFTDTINDGTTTFEVDITGITVSIGNYDGFIIEKQVNGGGFNDSVDIGLSISYTDNNFTGTVSFQASAYAESGSAWNGYIAQYRDLDGTKYRAAYANGTNTDANQGQYLILTGSGWSLTEDGFIYQQSNSLFFDIGTATSYSDWGQSTGSIADYAAFSTVAFPYFNTSITPASSLVPDAIAYGSGSFIADGSTWTIEIWDYRTNAIDGLKYYVASPAGTSYGSDANDSNPMTFNGNFTAGDGSGAVVKLLDDGLVVAATDVGTGTSWSFSSPSSDIATSLSISSYAGMSWGWSDYGYVSSPSLKYSSSPKTYSNTDNNPAGGFVWLHAQATFGNASSLKIIETTPRTPGSFYVGGTDTSIYQLNAALGDTTVTPNTIGFLGDGTTYSYGVLSFSTPYQIYSSTAATGSNTLPNDGNYYILNLDWPDVSGCTYKMRRQIGAGALAYKTVSPSAFDDDTTQTWDASSTVTPTQYLSNTAIFDHANASDTSVSNVLIRNTTNNAFSAFLEFQGLQGSSYTSLGKVGFKSDGTLAIVNNGNVGNGGFSFGPLTTPYVRLASGTTTSGNVFNVQGAASRDTTFNGSGGVVLAHYNSTISTVLLGSTYGAFSYDPTSAVAIRPGVTTDVALTLYPNDSAAATATLFQVKNSSASVLAGITNVGRGWFASSSNNSGNLYIGAGDSTYSQIQLASTTTLATGNAGGMTYSSNVLYFNNGTNKRVQLDLGSGTNTYYWRSDANGYAQADTTLFIQSGVALVSTLQLQAKQGVALDAAKDLTMGNNSKITGNIGTTYSGFTANQTLNSTHHIANATANTFNFTLPTAASISGREYYLINSGTGVSTLLTTSSQTINGLASGAITLAQRQGLKVLSDGSNWISPGVLAGSIVGTLTGAQVTGSALTKTDDTNVTLTLGGSPTTALLNAASLTLGWTGTLAVSRGGTGQATPVVVSGSFSGVGTATTVFTVTIGATQANTTYKVVIEPTNPLACAVQYVTNKTTTTFDVTYIAGLTGTVTFDWALFT